MIVDVALPLPIDREYSYVAPDALAGRTVAGARVLVPFGRRKITGVIVRTGKAASERDDLKAVLDVLDERPALTDELLRLTRWIADYYVCSWGEALRAALPPGIEHVTEKSELHVRLEARWREPATRETLMTDLRGERQKAVVRALAASDGDDEIWIRQADVLARSGASSSTLKRLEELGVLERAEREVVRVAFPGVAPAAVDRPLHGAQQQALERIIADLQRQAYRTHLLYGVTGSGKTEVYIRALKAALELGRGGIILVPEIALTPQTVARFRAHFGDEIAVLHSRMSLGERYDAWRSLRDGRFRIAVGPRSAVLAPLSDLGLIVVDEEHESSYKQFDPAPRYHARDVAVMRASMNGAVCVLGSATPSLESYINAAETGKYNLLEMQERVPSAEGTAVALPEVSVLDLVLERKKHRLNGALSETLVQGVARRLEAGEQVILLQNRRGFAPVIECRECGWVPECPDCSVSFTYHKATGRLKCHYCGRTHRTPNRCAECGQAELHQLGVGTQRVEEEILERFPTARVLRMDMDTTSKKGAHHTILERFRSGAADILLGTQMVAKGLDFPRVTLVGVVNADTSLLLPDFRAEERTFQLLTQVAGRAGRKDLPGQVVLQTRNADAPVLSHAASHDYRRFVEYILPERRQFHWPPYVRLVAVEFRGPEEAKVRDLAYTWTTHLRREAADAIVLEPAPALVSRIKKQHRYRTLVKAARADASVQDAIRRAMSAAPSVPRGYRVVVDVDPVDVA